MIAGLRVDGHHVDAPAKKALQQISQERPADPMPLCSGSDRQPCQMRAVNFAVDYSPLVMMMMMVG